jgi:hypothetical protein
MTDTGSIPHATATAQDLAHIYSVPLGTIWRWASLDRWGRTKYARPVRYSWADADASFRRYRKES